MIRKFEKDSIIYREGKPATEVYRIISGTIRCTRLFNKIEEIEVGVLGPGAILGLVSVMRDSPHIETTHANERTELELYKKIDFERLVTFQPDIGLEVLTTLSAQIRELNKLIRGGDFTALKEEPVSDDMKLKAIGDRFFQSERYEAAGYIFSRYIELYPAGTCVAEVQQKLDQIQNDPAEQDGSQNLNNNKGTEQSSRLYQPGEVIFCEYEPGSEVFSIEAGKVKVIKIEEDSEKILALLGPGEIFGEMSVLDGGPRSATVIAVEPTRAIVLTRNEFIQTLKEKPEVVVKLIQQFCKRLSAYAINYPHLFQRHRYKK
jgi:CRP-like cAMP-binding protein